jgi:hypothetical protein
VAQLEKWAAKLENFMAKLENLTSKLEKLALKLELGLMLGFLKHFLDFTVLT